MGNTAQFETKAAWVAWQLANDFGIEKTPEEVWFSIYQDAAGDSETALAMLEDIADDEATRREFAYSFVPREKVVVVDGNSQVAAYFFLALGFVTGVVSGLLF